MTGALDESVFFVKREESDLLPRREAGEDSEAVEHRDQRAVIEVAEIGVALNLAARIGADYAAETKMTEATKAGNLTPAELRSLVQWAVIVGNFGTAVVLGTIYFMIWIMTHG
jgi:hypothetical protein